MIDFDHKWPDAQIAPAMRLCSQVDPDGASYWWPWQPLDLVVECQIMFDKTMDFKSAKCKYAANHTCQAGLNCSNLHPNDLCLTKTINGQRLVAYMTRNLVWEHIRDKTWQLRPIKPDEQKEVDDFLDRLLAKQDALLAEASNKKRKFLQVSSTKKEEKKEKEQPPKKKQKASRSEKEVSKPTPKKDEEKPLKKEEEPVDMDDGEERPKKKIQADDLLAQELYADL